MKIGIDARFFGPEFKGIGRYTQKLITHLQKIDNKNEYYIFLQKKQFKKIKFKNNNFHKVLANYKIYSLKEQLIFPFLLYKYQLDLVHFLNFNIPILYFKKFIVTIHDLIIHESKKNSSNLPVIIFFIKKLIYKFIINLAIKFSNKIITVSNYSKNKIINKYNIDPNKIIVIYEASK
ncbi:MAG TPA: glycosyltransferase [Patescibacteria group bacterium]|nr:glycosyltransferase [Patescibacteria group bacterium]